MQTCKRRLSPSLITETNYAFQKAADQLRLKGFTDKRINWHILLEKYTETYMVSRYVYKLFRDMKREKLAIEADPHHPQYLNKIRAFSKKFHDTFSQESFRKSVGQHLNTLRTTPSNERLSEKDSFPRMIHDTRFGHLADYILYNMACGSDIQKSEHFWARDEDSFDNHASIEMIKTPFGSSFEFIPPKITHTDLFICSSPMRHIFDKNKNQQTFEEIQKNIEQRNDVYIGGWSDRNQKRYPNLYTYVFDNINPDVLEVEDNESNDSESSEDNFIWWETNVESQVVEVWQNYDEAYRRLVKTELLPELFNTDSSDKNENASLPFS